jgi:hypothetical protein
VLSGLGYSPAEIGRLRTAGALADDGLTELPDEAISAIPAISASALAIAGGRRPPGKNLGGRNAGRRLEVCQEALCGAYDADPLS